ncbi:hypothetical protein J3R30DRAFT_158638 [Lentinula aciculospora]|uniref:Uncharacterized protein n=1 Tax=Lentinula aciculospora TaxID=153920 RepID=A0A9W9DXC0_9AGAR|nr:hypothetical protein J3R30DRAFT_158638 [Lentinula aciculospora]
MLFVVSWDFFGVSCACSLCLAVWRCINIEFIIPFFLPQNFLFCMSCVIHNFLYLLFLPFSLVFCSGYLFILLVEFVLLCIHSILIIAHHMHILLFTFLGLVYNISSHPLLIVNYINTTNTHIHIILQLTSVVSLPYSSKLLHTLFYPRYQDLYSCSGTSF